MALLKPYPLQHSLRRMASRFLLHSHYHTHTLSFSSISLSRPSIVLNPRVINKPTRLSDAILIRNMVSPRAFMSSSTATEAFQENTKSKAYGSEQIQVNDYDYIHHVDVLFLCKIGESKELLIMLESDPFFWSLDNVGPFLKPERGHHSVAECVPVRYSQSGVMYTKMGL